MNRTSTGKHVLTPKGYVRSPEVKRRARIQDYQRAGVPAVYADLGPDQITGHERFVVLPFPFRDNKPRIFWIRGKEISNIRAASWSYAIMRYIDSGKTARMFRLPDLIDRYFAKEKEEWRETWRIIREAGILVIEVTNNDNHKYGPRILQEIFVHRSRNTGLTVFVSSDSISSMPTRYGHELAKAFGKIANTRRFFQVK